MTVPRHFRWYDIEGYLWLAGRRLRRGTKKIRSAARRLISAPITSNAFSRFRVLRRTVFRFCKIWLKSRPFRPLAIGVPVVFLGAALVVVLGIAQQVTDSDLVTEYHHSALKAWRADQLVEADLWMQKTIWLDPYQPTYRYNLGLIADAQGDARRAMALMSSTAPVDKRGYPPAHLWIARKLLADPTLRDASWVEKASEHLLVAASSQAYTTAAHMALGDLHVARRDAEDAIAHFEVASRKRPELFLILAQLYRAVGDSQHAAVAAQQSVDYYRRRWTANPDQWDLGIRLALSQMQLEQYPQAISVLTNLHRTAPADEMERALAFAHLAWFDHVVKNEPTDFGKQLDLLDRALAYEPRNARALGLLADIALGQWDEPKQMENILTMALGEGVAPSLVHVILGVKKMACGQTPASRRHLDIAQENAPHTVFLLAGLARELAKQDDTDLKRALRLAEIACELSDDPEILATRTAIETELGG